MRLRARRGATLLEMLIAIGILALIFTLLGLIFIGHGVFFQRENAAVDAALATTGSLNDILAQAREAVGMEAVVVDDVTYQSGPTQLVLKLYSLDENGLYNPATYDYAVYLLDEAFPNHLIKRVFANYGSSRPSEAKLLNGYVKSLFFSYNEANVENANQLTVWLASAKTVAGQEYVSSSTISVVLRNKQ